MRWTKDFQPEAWLSLAWDSPRSHLPFPIGEVGYSLPDFSDLDVVEIKDDTVHGNLHVKASKHGSNYLFVSRSSPPRRRVNVVYGAGAFNNILVIGKDVNVTGDIFFNSIGGLVIVGENIDQISPLTFWVWNNEGVIFWGSKSTSNGVTLNTMENGNSLIVGDDCMFAHAIAVRNSDQHAMLDMTSRKVINPGKKVVIEPRSWICQGSLILKGVNIGFGSIVSAGSVVTRSTPRFSLTAGSPATIRRRDVSWHRMLTPPEGSVLALRQLAKSVPTCSETAYRDE